MINIAFNMIGGENWRGGYNYLLNLVRTLSDYSSDEVCPFLFIGNDVSDSEVAPFLQIPTLRIIRSHVFNKSQSNARLLRALLLGCDNQALGEFSKVDINIVFESAQFYGWRFPITTLAWIPDFQHKHLKHYFNFFAYWKREIGFRFQVFFGRHIMLSSNDARFDCEAFYSRSKNKTHVVHFHVPKKPIIEAKKIRDILNFYSLPDVFFFLPNQFWKHKNHECVIRALYLLRQQNLNFVVVATGREFDPRDPSHIDNIRHLITKLNLESNFRMLGMIPHEHVDALMQKCVGLINPSKFEGWSTTVEEAKSMGRPMILSSISVHHEQAKNAIFFDPNSPSELANALVKFSSLSNEDDMSDAMAIYADNFTCLLKNIVFD